MNKFTINLSTEQIALVLGLLKPYAELSANFNLSISGTMQKSCSAGKS